MFTSTEGYHVQPYASHEAMQQLGAAWLKSAKNSSFATALHGVLEDSFLSSLIALAVSRCSIQKWGASFQQTIVKKHIKCFWYIAQSIANMTTWFIPKN